MTTTLSVRLPDELSQQLELLAAASKRTKSFCAIEAIRDYVKNESWQLQAIEEGLEDVRNGRLVDHSKVKDWVESWDSFSEKSPPQCE